MKDFLVALQFLTILPVKIGPQVEDKAFGRSLAWFPFVGILIGLVSSTPLLLYGVLPQMVIAALTIMASIVVTGGIHLDGFADTCDGLSALSSSEKALEIMRDSHIGTMASAGVTVLLILKFSLLSVMPKDMMLQSIILMAAFARWGQVFSCFVSKYARRDGKAKHFVRYASQRELTISSIFILTLFLFLLGIKGAALLALSILPTFAIVHYIKTRIGGMTGDTIGAVSEVSEVIVLLFGLALRRYGL